MTTTPAPDAGLWRYRHVHDYLAFVREARAILARGGRVRLHWAGRDLDADGFRRELRRALDSRINAKAEPDRPRGRRDDPDHVRALRQDQRDLRDRVARRVRVYQFRTPEVRRRFGHLLARYDD